MGNLPACYIMFAQASLPLSDLHIKSCLFSRFSCVRLFATPWAVVHQAPLSTGFSQQGYWILYHWAMQETQETQVGSLGWEDPPWRRKWQPTPPFLPGKSHGLWSKGSQSQPWLSDWAHIKSGRPGLDPWIGKVPCRREWLRNPVELPEEFHGQRSLAGYSPWGHTTEQLSLSLKYSSGYFFEKKKNHGDRKEFSKPSSVVEHQGSVLLYTWYRSLSCFNSDLSMFLLSLRTLSLWYAIEILHGIGCYYCSQDGFEFSL